MADAPRHELTWRDLAELVMKEQDPAKVLRLVQQLNAALDSDSPRLTAGSNNPYLKIKTYSLPRFLNDSVLVTEADLGSVQLFDSSRGELRLIICQGFGSEFSQHFDRVNLDNCACGTALKRRSRVVVSDVMSDPAFDEPSRGTLVRASALSVQSTPVFGKFGELIGMISTHSNKPRMFSPEQLHNLDQVIANFVATLTT